jgi:hypothetical protein
MAFFYWIRSLNRWCSIDIVKLSIMSVMKRVYLLHVVSRAAFSRAQGIWRMAGNVQRAVSIIIIHTQSLEFTSQLLQELVFVSRIHRYSFEMKLQMC